MKKLFTLLVAATACLCLHAPAHADHLSDRILFTARMDGAQETPPVFTPAIGLASVWLNGTRDTLCVTISMRDLTDSLTGVHIHRAPIGQPGPIVISLSPYVIGNQVVATITGAALTDSIVRDLLMGRLYVNAHTVTNPDGEIRGQLVPESDYALMAQLNGNFTVPPTPTPAQGLASFKLSKSKQQMRFHVVVQGMDTMTDMIDSVFLMVGPLDSAGNGVVVENLTGFMNAAMPDHLMGTVNPTAYVSDLLANNVYVSVRTANFPNGELIGRLFTDTMIVFGSHLTASQETPPTPSMGSGIGVIRLTGGMDSLLIDVLTTNLTGPPTSAHFHDAPEGVPGPVVLDLTPFINGYSITGVVTGAQLNDSLINKLLRGELYLNVHTDSFPNGEVRGQIYKKLREAYAFMLQGSQVVPPVSGNDTAFGSGIVSIATDTSDLHYLSLYGGLNDSVNGANFGNGVTGQSGTSFFNLYPWFQSSTNALVEGFWSTTDATSPFTPTFAQSFANDSVFVGLNTGSNPNGALRGQVSAVSQCDQLSVGVFDEAVLMNSEMSVYPNPVADNDAFVRFVTSVNANGRLTLTDMLGRNAIDEALKIHDGTNTWNVDMHNVKTGVYIVRLQIGNSLVSQRLNVQ